MTVSVSVLAKKNFSKPVKDVKSLRVIAVSDLLVSWVLRRCETPGSKMRGSLLRHSQQHKPHFFHEYFEPLFLPDDEKRAC